MLDIKLTDEQKAEAEACGMSEAEYSEMLQSRLMPEGTYKVTIQAAKCETSKKGKQQDARQLNMRVLPLSSDGIPVKRFGSTFVRLTSPRAEGAFVPSPRGRSFSVDQFRLLAEYGSTTLPDLLGELHGSDQISSLVGGELTVTIKHTPGENGVIFTNANIAKESADLSDLQGDSK